MFFVSESITSDYQEFALAMRRFACALQPGAPFAIALMENSRKYDVGGRKFAAVPVGVTDAREVLDGLAEGLRIHRIALDDDPLRKGYTGMVLALGRTAYVSAVG